MPAAKPPRLRPASNSASSGSTSASAAGRRNARRASRARISRAQGRSSASAAGRQAKSRRPAGVAVGSGAARGAVSSGPSTSTVHRAGSSVA